MDNFPERNYKDEGARLTYQLHKNTVEMLKKQGRENEIQPYLEGKIEATDKMEQIAESNIKTMVGEERVRRAFGTGKWIITIILVLIAVIAIAMLSGQ